MGDAFFILAVRVEDSFCDSEFTDSHSRVTLDGMYSQ